MKQLTNTTTRAQTLILAFPTPPANSTSTLESKRARQAQNSFDPVNSPSSTEITQVLDEHTAANEVHDSDDPSLSTTMSLEDQSDLPWIPHQPRQSTTQGSSQPEQNPPKEASEEEVISAALDPPTKRHERLPQVFGRQGRLPHRWNYLRPRINAVREEQKRRAVVNEQKMQSILEAPLGIPKGFNISPALQSVEEVVEPVLAQERRKSFHGENAEAVSHAQPSDPNELVDLKPDDRPPQSPLGLPSQTKNHGPKIGNFFTQSKKKHANLKTYGQGRNQSLKGSIQKAQRRAENAQPRRLLRSGLSAKPSDAFQSLPVMNFTPQQSSGQQPLSLPPAELPPLSEIPPPSLPEEIERSPALDTITVDSSQVRRQKSSPPLPSQTSLVLASPSARERETATRVLYGRIQQQMSRKSRSCPVCRQKGCSCNATEQHLEEILCSDIGCYKKWWGVEDLWNYCGIKLSDAQNSKRDFNCWFCPQCSNKARVLLQYELTNSASSSICRTPTALIQEGLVHSGCPDNALWPEDGELREPLQHLTGMMQQYTGNTTMARNKLSPINSQTRIIDIPCIRDETLDQSAGIANHATLIIRKLLDVSDGILIKDKIRQAKLQDTTCPIWIRGVLSFLVSEFVFHSGSPFEDAMLWKKTLADAGHSPDEAENLIHDHRIRVMKAYEKSPDDPEIPPEFLDRVTRRRQTFVEQLNTTMLPLVGGNSNIQVRHQQMAKVALELHLKTSAYRGKFEEIMPQMLDSFNLERHAEENPGPDYPDLVGRSILVTTMPGVRFKHPEKDWRTCVRAKVKVSPVNSTEWDPPNRASIPDIPGGSPSNQTNRHFVPQKRQIEEVA